MRFFPPPRSLSSTWPRAVRSVLLIGLLAAVLVPPGVAPASGPPATAATRAAVDARPSLDASPRAVAVAAARALARIEAQSLKSRLYVRAVAAQRGVLEREQAARAHQVAAATSSPAEPHATASAAPAGPAPAAPPAAGADAAPPADAPGPICPSGTMSPLARDLFDATNAERTANGLPALALDGCLVHIAQHRADDMASRNYFAHVSPEGESFATLLDDFAVDFYVAAENLARNNAADAGSVDLAIRSLMDSEPHRANILSSEVAYLGVAEATDAAGMKYYVMIFVGR